MKRILSGLVIFCFSVGVVSLSGQQEATVNHGVSLRGDPSTKNPPIDHLNRTATATLLALKPNTGFYHVQTADKTSAATYSAKISEFNSKLETAQREQDDLNRRVKCLDKSASDLEQTALRMPKCKS